MKRLIYAAALCAAVFVSGCKNEAVDQQSAPDSPVIADEWLGRWTGVEGTFLEIEKNDTHYTVKIRSLDELKIHEAVPVPEGLELQRDGVTHVIHAGDGETTGMKWLMDKQNCLIVKYGEGYCRD